MQPPRSRRLGGYDAQGLQELLDGNGQVADPLAGRVKDGIGDGRRDRNGCQFTETFRTKWARLFVERSGEDHVQLRDIRVSGYEVAGIILMQKARHVWIRLGFRFFLATESPPSAAITCSGAKPAKGTSRPVHASWTAFVARAVGRQHDSGSCVRRRGGSDGWV